MVFVVDVVVKCGIFVVKCGICGGKCGICGGKCGICGGCGGGIWHLKWMWW